MSSNKHLNIYPQQFIVNFIKINQYILWCKCEQKQSTTNFYIKKLSKKGFKGMKLFKFAINSYLIQLETACIYHANFHQGWCVSHFEIYSKYSLEYIPVRKRELNLILYR